jgi:PKD repeat protein
LAAVIRYRQFILIAALLTLGLLSLSLASHGLEVSDGIGIAQTDANEDDPQIAVDSQGGFHVVYESYDFDTESGKLEYQKVSSIPSVLVGPTTISASNVDRINSYEIAVDSSDRVHVVYVPVIDDELEEIHYVQLSSDGKIVIPAKRIYNSNDPSVSPSLDTDRNGNVYIVWTKNNEVMWMKLSSSGGVTEPGQVISDSIADNEQVAFPRIGVSPAGNCYVVWNFQGIPSTGGQWTVYYSSLSSSGEVDVEPIEILSNLVVSYWGVKAALDSGYNLHLTFMLEDRVRGYAVGYARVDEDGTVSIEERLDDPPRTGMAWWPDIDVNPADDVYVAFQMLTDDFEGDWNIYLMASEDGGSTWEQSLQLTFNDVSQGPTIAAGFGVAGISHGYQHEDIHMVVVSEEGMNHPPVPDFEVNPQNPAVGASVEYDGRRSYDPDENDQVEEWFYEFGDGNDSGWVRTAIVQYGNGYSEEGVFTASLSVRDSHGLESSAVATVNIKVGTPSSNFQPLAKIIAIPETADIGEEIVFNGGTSYDPDGSVALFNFDFGDGTTTGWVTQDYQYHSYDSEGIYTAVLVVKDNEGSESEPAYERVTIIHTNEAPTATIESISPSIAMEGEEVAFNGTCIDVDGTIKVYQWMSDLDGIIGMTETFVRSDLKVGVHNITFKVKDNEDEWSAEDSFILVITANQDFVLEDKTTGPGSKTDTRRRFQVVYTDLENDVPTIYNLLYAKGENWREERLLEVDPNDQDFTDGKEYFVTLDLNPGKWKYSFEFANGKNLRKTTEVAEFEVKEESPLFPAWEVVPVFIAFMVTALALIVKRRN